MHLDTSDIFEHKNIDKVMAERRKKWYFSITFGIIKDERNISLLLVYGHKYDVQQSTNT
jgi:hypothetical protein